MKLCVIGTFYGRHENSLPLFHRLFVDSTYKPDQALLLCETGEDYSALMSAYYELNELEVIDEWPSGLEVTQLSTPSTDGAYDVIPYSHKINAALDHTDADLIVYLDNNSMPDADKFRVMKEALEAHPEQGAVYCAQKRTGWSETIAPVGGVVDDAYCVLNFTQVMHRKTDDRWTLDMRHANPDLADALFWRSLHASIGSFYPVEETAILDTHHMPTTAASLV